MNNQAIAKTQGRVSIFQGLINWVQSISFLNWFFQKGYAQGVFWAIMIGVFSATNDVLMRFLGERLHVVEISFFRFFFSLITVLPLMFHKGGISLFKTDQPGMHFWRALIGAAAIGLCCYSVNIMPLSENTTIMFAEPLFFLLLAYLILKENVDTARWVATLVGFLGLIIILQPGSDTLRVEALVPMTAALFFAMLNILAKMMITTEDSLTLLFYFGLGTTLLSAIPLWFYWQSPTISELLFLLLLGISANMIQVCLFRAFSATDASALTPFRYFEFIVAALFGFIFFSQIPTVSVLWGALLIVASTYYISIVETRREKGA
jgi:S-adenosylmethionine uptake transporter